MNNKFILLILIFLYSSFAMSQEIEENILENPTYQSRMIYFKTHPLMRKQIVFLGNSLTQGGKWNEYFPIQNPANRGIAGDNTLGMLGRLHEIIEARPSKLFIMAGINDISLGRSNEKIITCIKSIIYQVKTGSPDTQIYVQSVLPINNDIAPYTRLKGKEKQIERLNKDLERFSAQMGAFFVNLYPSFLSSKSKLDVKYTTDGLHLNDAGYALWSEKIRTIIE